MVSWSGGRAQLERTLGSLDGRRDGARPEDRPWLARLLELAPARFATAVLDDPGCNLSMWNLHCTRSSPPPRGRSSTGAGRCACSTSRASARPPPSAERAGQPRADQPLAGAARAVRALRRRARRRRVGGASIAAADVGRRLADGLVYDDALRRAAHARRSARRALRGSVRASGEDARAFTSWLEGPAPAGAAHGVNRYVYYRVARERPDVMRAYPDLDGADGADYVDWCWVFGREEVAIPDRFMPPRPGSRRPARSRPRARGRPREAPEPPAERRRRRSGGSPRGVRADTRGASESPERTSPALRTGPAGGARHRLSRPHARAGRGRAGLCAGAARRPASR